MTTDKLINILSRAGLGMGLGYVFATVLQPWAHVFSKIVMPVNGYRTDAQNQFYSTVDFIAWWICWVALVIIAMRAPILSLAIKRVLVALLAATLSSALLILAWWILAAIWPSYWE